MDKRSWQGSYRAWETRLLRNSKVTRRYRIVKTTTEFPARESIQERDTRVGGNH